MGAPESGMHAAEQPGADELLGAFKRIGADERRRHEAVLNYWLSIRGDKEFPPLHDLDPLELSDAAPSSILLELLSGGHDAEIRHRGEALKEHVDVERIIDAPHPSLLSSIAKKLPIVAISRDFLAFEDEFAGPQGKTRCWVTLLPLSAGGAWVDYVYGLVSLATHEGSAAEPAKKVPKKADAPEPAAVEVPEAPEVTEEMDAEPAEEPVAEVAEEPEAVHEPVAEEPEEVVETAPEAELEEAPEAVEEAADDEDPPEAVEAEEPAAAAVEAEPEVAEPETDAVEAEPEVAAMPEADADATETLAAEVEQEAEAPEAIAEPAPKGVPGFAKLFDSLAGLTGFYGSQPVKLDPVIDEAPAPEGAVEEAPAAEEPVAELPVEEAVAEQAPVQEEIIEEAPAETPLAAEQPAAESPPADHQPAPAMEGSLQSKLTQVRAKADEVRQARQRAIAALHEGLSAAYDFALDAEEAPEEYLKLVEAQGLKIQLRSPMKPVVKLAFDGTCDEATIKQLEAVLAWALKEELPKGTLGQRIEDAGGIEGLLNGERKAA